MSFNTATGQAILSPAQVDTLFVKPVLALSVAAQVARTVIVSASSLRVPIVTADPSAAWVDEGAEIPVTDSATTDLAVPFFALKGLSSITNEALADTSGLAQQLVGEGLARDTARKLDKAFWAATTPDGPGGIASVSGVQLVAAGNVTNFDPFEDALAAAESVGAQVGAWVMHPDTAKALAKIKTGTGSNATLLQPDPTMPTRRAIKGVAVYATPDVAAGVIWCVPVERTIVAVRQAVDIVADSSVYFSSDRTAVRSVARVGFSFIHPEAIVKMSVTL